MFCWIQKGVSNMEKNTEKMGFKVVKTGRLIFCHGKSQFLVGKKIGTPTIDGYLMWVKQCHLHHPPVITINI